MRPKRSLVDPFPRTKAGRPECPRNRSSSLFAIGEIEDVIIG